MGEGLPRQLQMIMLLFSLQKMKGMNKLPIQYSICFLGSFKYKQSKLQILENWSINLQ